MALNTAIRLHQIVCVSAGNYIFHVNIASPEDIMKSVLWSIATEQMLQCWVCGPAMKQVTSKLDLFGPESTVMVRSRLMCAWSCQQQLEGERSH